MTRNTTNKKAFHHRDLKNALLEHALTILDEQGESSVTIRAVARAAGVSHAAPVNHYKDRTALLTAIASTQFELIRQDIINRLQNPELSPTERIDSFADAIFDYGFKHPNRYRLIWRADVIDQSDPVLLQAADGIYDPLCQELERALPSGALAKFDRDSYAVMLWSIIHGYTDLRLNGLFLDKSDSVNGLPRRRALLDLFNQLLV